VGRSGDTHVGDDDAMSPRPVPHRDDETAATFLDAGAALIDAMLSPDRSGPLPPRIRQLHYPAPLEWIRIEDVLRIAGGPVQASRKAFYNRWPTKDDYIRDCFLHALLYRDKGGSPLTAIDQLLGWFTNTSIPLTTRLRGVAAGIAAGLLNDPRSYLLSHAAAMVNEDPETARLVAESAASARDMWRTAYRAVLEGADLTLRPGWTIDSLIMVVQMLIDGMVTEHRISWSDDGHDVPTLSATLGDAFVAILGSVIDFEKMGETMDTWIESRASAGTEAEPALI
jgi:hypothetical protein